MHEEKKHSQINALTSCHAFLRVSQKPTLGTRLHSIIATYLCRSCGNRHQTTRLFWKLFTWPDLAQLMAKVLLECLDAHTYHFYHPTWSWQWARHSVWATLFSCGRPSRSHVHGVRLSHGEWRRKICSSWSRWSFRRRDICARVTHVKCNCGFVGAASEQRVIKGGETESYAEFWSDIKVSKQRWLDAMRLKKESLPMDETSCTVHKIRELLMISCETFD